jgi:hypothetical protein
MTQGSSFLATLGWMIAILSGLPSATEDVLLFAPSARRADADAGGTEAVSAFLCAEGATEISPVLVRWWPCASTYAGKSSHKINSFSASDGEKVAGGRMR